MKSHPRKIIPGLAALGVALLLGACGNSAQNQAYEHAAQFEQQLSSEPERAPAAIAEYQCVIRLDPGSACAKKAQARIDAIKAQVKAEEMRKSVFQEHGID